MVIMHSLPLILFPVNWPLIDTYFCFFITRVLPPPLEKSIPLFGYGWCGF